MQASEPIDCGARTIRTDYRSELVCRARRVWRSGPRPQADSAIELMDSEILLVGKGRLRRHSNRGVRPTPQQDLSRATIEVGHNLRVDPIAYAWRACNPGAPLPRLLGRALEGAAVFYAERRLLESNITTEQEL